MTNGELQAELAKFPSDLVVSVTGYEGGITDHFTVKRIPVELNAFTWQKGSLFGEHDVVYPGDKSDAERLLIDR